MGPRERSFLFLKKTPLVSSITLYVVRKREVFCWLRGGCSETVSRQLVELKAGVQLPSPTLMIDNCEEKLIDVNDLLQTRRGRAGLATIPRLVIGQGNSQTEARPPNEAEIPWAKRVIANTMARYSIPEGLDESPRARRARKKTSIGVTSPDSISDNFAYAFLEMRAKSQIKSKSFAPQKYGAWRQELERDFNPKRDSAQTVLNLAILSKLAGVYDPPLEEITCLLQVFSQPTSPTLYLAVCPQVGYSRLGASLPQPTLTTTQEWGETSPAAKNDRQYQSRTKRALDQAINEMSMLNNKLNCPVNIIISDWENFFRYRTLQALQEQKATVTGLSPELIQKMLKTYIDVYGGGKPNAVETGLTKVSQKYLTAVQTEIHPQNASIQIGLSTEIYASTLMPQLGMFVEDFITQLKILGVDGYLNQKGIRFSPQNCSRWMDGKGYSPAEMRSMRTDLYPALRLKWASMGYEYQVERSVVSQTENGGAVIVTSEPDAGPKYEPDPRFIKISEAKQVPVIPLPSMILLQNRL